MFDNPYIPKHIDVEDLVPVIEPAPRSTLGTDAGVVHEYGDL